VGRESISDHASAGVEMLVRHIVLVLVVPTSLSRARIAHTIKSYVGQAVLVLERVC